MTLDDWERTIREASEYGCSRLQFIGGEPTLHPHFARLLALAVRERFSFIEVYSNVVRLSEETLAEYKAMGIHVACSFYSSRANVHDRITQRAGSHRQTVENIRRIVRAGVPIRVGVIEMEANAGEYDATREFLASLGANHVGVDRLRGVGRGTPHRLPTSPDRELCGRCWAGKLCVSADAAVYPCVFARHLPLGDVRDGLAPILASRLLADFRSDIRAMSRALSNCQPRECEPTGGECRPDYCNPDFCCSPNEPTECGPERG